MTQDDNKQIGNVEYTYNNRPERITMTQNRENIINYAYDATGTKLAKRPSSDRARGLRTDYVGNFVYKKNELAYILTDQGRIVPRNDGFEYQYFIKDHLGNTRVVFNDEGEILQDKSYYTFKMLERSGNPATAGRMDGLDYSATGLDPDNKNLYNGKEFQDDFGLDWYDYGARMYDAQLGRFICVDPIANSYTYVTPYNYTENDPVSSVDLWGLQKYKLSSEISLTSGKFGIKAKLFGVFGLGGSYTKGGIKQTIELYSEVDIQSWKMNFGISHTQTHILQETTGAYGPFHAAEGEKKVIRRDLSIQNGATKPIDDNMYKDFLEGGIGPLKTKDKEGEKETTKYESGLEVNALIIGIEAGGSVEKTEDSDNNTNRNSEKSENKKLKDKIKENGKVK